MKKSVGYQRPDFSKVKNLTRTPAIRAFCIDCYCGVAQGAESPTNCPDIGCPLWRFRMGAGRTDTSFRVRSPERTAGAGDEGTE